MCSPPPCEVESPGEVIDWYAEEESPEGEWDEELMKWENKKNLPMHPVLPESWSDLRPLPPVAGPKLKPFDFGDDDSIEFLEVLADTKKCGTSIVMKVRIGGSIYALKLFRFFSPNSGPRRIDWSGLDSDEQHHYWLWCDEPFGAECRAIGRLQEAGREDLMAKCYGYLLLKKEYEILLEQRFGLIPSTWDAPNSVYDRNKEGRVFAQKDGQYRPIRGIVKEFVIGTDKFEPARRTKMLEDILSLHELGVIHGDVKEDAWIGGVLCDFSHSTTSPHGAINPEFTNQPKSNYSAFSSVHSDLLWFDRMVDHWNEWVGEPRGKKIWDRAIQDPRYGRFTLSGDGAYLRQFTIDKWKCSGRFPADPRRYDWRAGKAAERRPWIWQESRDNPEHDNRWRTCRMITFPRE